jgi:glycerol-3-phosphate dehydrogenase
MAEQVVDLVARLGGLPARPSPTADLRLHGAGENTRSVYGDDEAAVLAAGPPTLLHPRLPHTEAEVRWAARQELAETVEDVLARRTRALLLDACAAAECAPRVASILAEELDRDAAWTTAQISTFRALAAGHVIPGHAVS